MTPWGCTLSSEEHGPAALVAHAELAKAAGFDFRTISDHLHPWVTEDIGDDIICGPDLEVWLEAIRSYEAAGIDRVHLHQVGADQ